MEAVLVEISDGQAVFDREGWIYSYPLQNLSDDSRSKAESMEKGRLASLEEAKKWRKVYKELKDKLVEPRGRRTQAFDDSSLADKRYFVI